MIYVREIQISIEEIIDRYGDNIYRLAFSRTKNIYDAQDIMQDVFVKLINSNKHFETFDYLKAWLLRITINLTKNLFNTAWFKKTAELDENLATYIEEQSEVYKYVLNLSKKYRTVIHLFYYEDLKTTEIADLLKTKEGTIRSQLTRARNLLKENMKEVEFDVFG